MTVLAACRREAGFTQAQLGEACGFNQVWVSKIETGERGVQVVDLILIARALRIEPLVLFKRYLAFLPEAAPADFMKAPQLAAPPAQSPRRSSPPSKRTKRR